MIKCLLTELRRAGRENIWPSGQIFSRPARRNSVNNYIKMNVGLSNDDFPLHCASNVIYIYISY